jgi:cytochrome c peroxidase
MSTYSLAAARALLIGALVVATACERKDIGDPVAPPASLDAQLRATLGQWGAVPIGAVTAPAPALIDLGRALFFDKVLSGNRDVSCATCHSPLTGMSDALALSIGTGGVGAGVARALGAQRQLTPRSAPSLLDQGLGSFYLFWDGRVSDLGGQSFRTPAGAALPAGLTNLLAAQAMFPVTNRTEMRGNAGDVDVTGQPNELAVYDTTQYAAIWGATMRRVLAINAYVAKFSAAYPGVSPSSLGFQHAANAIAAFETASLTFTNTPFDRYLGHDDDALSTDAKRGALLFFGKARCSSCHFGALLGGQSFANAGVPQIGPGVGSATPLDFGQDPQFQGQTQRFLFRVPPLRNVELTPPYMHDGAFATLEEVVRHYNDVVTTLRAYDPSGLDPAARALYHGDGATIDAILTSLDGRLRDPLGLTDEEVRQLVVFLRSLTDPAARNLSNLIPASVPSGLPVR